MRKAGIPLAFLIVKTEYLAYNYIIIIGGNSADFNQDSQGFLFCLERGNKMPADLDLYSIFCTVARCGSLSHAARELYVSQPAISQSMHRLEYTLGCTLFTRTSRGITLTSEGRMLYSYADKAVSLITAAEDKLNRMRTLQSGGLMIGASDTLCQFFLLPYLEKFHTEYPEVQLQVTNRTTPDTVELLKVGKVDIALVNLPVDDSALCVRDVLQVHDVFVASERFAHLKGRPVTMAELSREPLVLLEQASNSRKYLDDFASVCGITLHPEIELGAHSLLVEFAKIGLGIACVTYEFAADAIHSGELFEVELSVPMPARNIGLISLEGVPLSAAADRFISIVMDDGLNLGEP